MSGSPPSPATRTARPAERQDAADDPIAQLRPTGSIPHALRGEASASPVARWWVPALTGEPNQTLARSTQIRGDAVRRHRTEDDGPDPLIVPSEWGVF